MSNILVLNSGSTSIKYALYDNQLNELVRNQVEHVSDYQDALKTILRSNIHYGEIGTIGHRVVHGGVKFTGALEVTSQNLLEIKQLESLAPLHNPHNIAGIEAAMHFLPATHQVAVFDTSFYSSMPHSSRIYALPQDLASQHGLYRFGFHGLSHEYVMEQAALELQERTEKLSIISLHLGGGASVTAIKNGKPIDTSMGYSPNEGLVMLSRSGDIDSNLVLDLFSMLPGEINHDKVESIRGLLNKQSGIKGMTGIDDFKMLLREYSLGNEETREIFNFYIQRIIKYIGAYHCLLEGKVSAIVLTGSIGSGLPITKEVLASKIRHLNVPILTIKTNEEFMIAKKIKTVSLK
ncbi:MAG: acetate kinase [bacterium]